MRTILDELICRLEQGESVVLCTVVRCSGSVPRSSGARMLVCRDGKFFGSTGGGVVEGRCKARALKLLGSGEQYEMADFTMDTSDAVPAGMICGGSVSVLLQLVGPDGLELMHRVRSSFSRDERAYMVTLLPANGYGVVTILVDGDGNSGLTERQITEISRKKRREPFLIDTGDREMLVEPLVRPGIVHLVGAGHVALATAHLASYVGFDVVVMDDRQEFANKERYPDASEVRVLSQFDNCLERLGPDDFVVIVTRSHSLDRDVLAQALRTDAGYIGMIGSKRKRTAVYDSLRADGFNEKDLKRVSSPIGLAIGADTPAEIGISIVAEMIMVRSGGRK